MDAMLDLLGLDAKTTDLHKLACEFMPTFKPKHDGRVTLVEDVMKPETGLQDMFLLEPLFDNAKKIIAQLAIFRVGAVVVGHKMSGKSQTLEFLMQFWRELAQQRDNKLYGVNLSMKKEGEGSGSPDTYKAMFELFHKHVWDVGVLKACRTMLQAALTRDKVQRERPSSWRCALKRTVR